MKTLLKMRKAGCYRVALGVESGVPEDPGYHRQEDHSEQIVETVNNCNKVGIKTMAFIMLGIWARQRRTMRETIEFAGR